MGVVVSENVTVAFQAAASQQGRNFEDVVESVLTFFGWRIVDRHAVVFGVEVDIIADDPNGIEWWIECKGSHRGARPGARRGDTVKKAVGVAWYLSTCTPRCPYMLVTSHLPEPETVAGRLLEQAQRAGLFDAVKVIDFASSTPIDDLIEEDQ